MNQKVHMAFVISTIFSKMKHFSCSHVHCYVVISRKRCQMQLLLL